MLGPLLQALWQQIGPTVQQLLTVAAPHARRIPPHVYVGAANDLSNSVSNWYDTLTLQNQKRIDDAIDWVVRDISGDIATAVTGLPIGHIVNKVLDIVCEYKDSQEAKNYINDEIVRQIVNRHTR